ncbi:MAG: CubicO group peptidase (beta-lactamase class C family) [Paracoccaceae bacterium]|jgi:CubicO group peptidase (beta-lactamase class C family)
MDRDITDRKYAGSSLMIAQGGSLIYDHQSGVRDIEDGQVFDQDTIARIYSMTKPITTVALMMLVEKGLVHLGAPISDFIPEFSDCQCLIGGAQRIDQVEDCASPTLHQLATHTSGMSYAFNPGLLPAEMEAREVMFRSKQGNLADMAVRAARLPLAFSPGSRWEYSVGIDILGRVIEVVTEQGLDQFFQEQIFDPLDMTATGFSVPKGQKSRFATLYSPLEGNAMDLNATHKSKETLNVADRVEGSEYLNASLFSGGGGLVGTIGDYMKFVECLRLDGRAGDARLLSKSTMSFMKGNHLRGDIASMGPKSFAEQPMEGVGFGLGGSTVLDPRPAGVPGNVGDFAWGGMASTFFWVDPILDLSVVFFTQLSPSSSYPTRAHLKAMVHAAVD